MRQENRERKLAQAHKSYQTGEKDRLLFGFISHEVKPSESPYKTKASQFGFLDVRRCRELTLTENIECLSIFNYAR